MSKLTKTSATCFLYHNNHYLFLKRKPNALINPGQLNGVGGKLEPGEDYLTCAVREIEEETGYTLQPENLILSGIIKFESKDREDWITCFFKAKVTTKKIPLGSNTKEGELIWIHKDKVLDSKNELVEDLYYVFKDIIVEKETFFLNAQTTGNKYKINKIVGKKLPIKNFKNFSG